MSEINEKTGAEGESFGPLTHRQKVWRVNIFALTWLSYTGFYFCRKAFPQVKEPLRELLDVNESGVAHIWTAFLLAYMAGQFITAYLGRKVACRVLILFGMGISLACNAAFGSFTELGPAAYWPFLIFMVINGLAQGSGWGSNIGILAHWFRRRERGTVMAFWSTCYMLGSWIAKMFASFMLGWLGLAWSFYGASIVLFVIWVAFYLWVRDKPEDYGMDAIVEERLAVVQKTAEGKVPRPVGLGWTKEVRRTLITVGVAYFCFKFVRYALDSWTPMLLEHTFGTETEAAGYRSALFDLAGFFGVVFGGFMTDRFFRGSRTMVTFCMTVGMLLSVIFLWKYGAGSIGIFVIGLACVGFMLAGPDSLLSGVGSIDITSKRGAVVAAAIINGIGSLGSVVQEQVIGAIKSGAEEGSGIEAVLALLVGVSAAGVVLVGLLVYRHRKGKSTL